MKSSEILREAARMVESGWNTYSCLAICDAANINTNLLAGLKTHPAGRAYSVLWGRLPNVAKFNGDNDLRVVALCLAAAIAESEGD